MEEKAWYEGTQAGEKAAISTRVRLARNLADTPFPALLDEDGRYAVCKKVIDAFRTAMPEKFGDFTVIDMAKLSEAAAVSLAERRLVSPEFAQAVPGSCLLLSKDHSVSVMLNEEDHIRIQVLESGLRLREAYKKASEIDDALSSELEIAFDDRLGYLTECPTNLGTGMRASVMLHLPAMRANGTVSRLAESASRLGFTVRGAYGEASEAKGAFYQISNQITLGITEEDAVDNLSSVVRQIIASEEKQRVQLLRDPSVEDRLWRSLGILRTARRLSGDEAVELASNLRLGIEQGVYKGEKLDCAAPNRIIATTGAATITARSGKDLSAAERDRQRADTVREIMG